MAPQSDLVKIGSEGFALIDEYFGKKRMHRAATTTAQNLAAGMGISTTFPATKQSCNYHYSSPETHIYRIIPATRIEAITAPAPSAALNSYEAAQLHDGIHLSNYSMRRQMRMAY
ncbi:hypothetical protein BC332_01899 [Capsicum chinense]|nr:hypothetical protein BC332_01899 [Capsicum chinense]